MRVHNHKIQPRRGIISITDIIYGLKDNVISKSLIAGSEVHDLIEHYLKLKLRLMDTDNFIQCIDDENYKYSVMVVSDRYNHLIEDLESVGYAVGSPLDFFELTMTGNIKYHTCGDGVYVGTPDIFQFLKKDDEYYCLICDWKITVKHQKILNNHNYLMQANGYMDLINQIYGIKLCNIYFSFITPHATHKYKYNKSDYKDWLDLLLSYFGESLKSHWLNGKSIKRINLL